MSLYIIFWDFEQIFMVPLVIVIAYTCLLLLSKYKAQYSVELLTLSFSNDTFLIKNRFEKTSKDFSVFHFCIVWIFHMQISSCNWYKNGPFCMRCWQWFTFIFFIYSFITSKVPAVASASADTAFLQAEFLCSVLGLSAEKRLTQLGMKGVI